MSFSFYSAKNTRGIMRGTYHTEFEEIQIDRVRHRWAAIYVFSFYLYQNK